MAAEIPSGFGIGGVPEGCLNLEVAEGRYIRADGTPENQLVKDIIFNDVPLGFGNVPLQFFNLRQDVGAKMLNESDLKFVNKLITHTLIPEARLSLEAEFFAMYQKMDAWQVMIVVATDDEGRLKGLSKNKEIPQFFGDVFLYKKVVSEINGDTIYLSIASADIHPAARGEPSDV